MNTPNTDSALIEEIRREIRAKHDELATSPADPGLIPLKIACVMASCKHGRHCLDHLRRPRKGDKLTKPGHCRDCGAHILDLPDVEGRRYGDLHEIVATSLDQQNELIRAHYWHVPIDLKAFKNAQRLGRRELYRRAADRVRTALTLMDAYAGRRTPYHGDVIAYAQHATAACCRRCATYWHGLPSGSPLAQRHINHILFLVRTYLDIRLPDLPDDPAPPASVGVVTQAMQPNDRRISEIDRQVATLIVTGTDPTGLLQPDKSTLQLDDARDADGGYLFVRNHIPEQRGQEPR
jgi:Domain of unknown function (DUF4186)